jgi:hypothetical protein
MARLRALLLLFAMLMFALPAVSQGCALCYTQAAGSGANLIRALRLGILMLVLPATSYQVRDHVGGLSQVSLWISNNSVAL